MNHPYPVGINPQQHLITGCYQKGGDSNEDLVGAGAIAPGVGKVANLTISSSSCKNPENEREEKYA